MTEKDSWKPGQTCAAAKDKSAAGLGGERCGAPAMHETVLGYFCKSCLQHARDSYDGSLLKMMRDVIKNPR